MRDSASATIHSMTGFARVSGSAPPYRWAWELKSVNSKGLDLRLRLPPGFDSIEISARARLTQSLARGACSATLTTEREATAATVRLNLDLIAAIGSALRAASVGDGLRPASLDALLGVPGVLEVTTGAIDETSLAAAAAAILDGLDAAIEGLLAMRHVEGESLAVVIARRLAAIDRLTDAAEAAPSRAPEAIRARLAHSIAVLLDAGASLDPSRLHLEAVLLAAKADIREELDRLKTHVAAARQLLSAGGPVGRRLDFLAQELAREANTLCAKANDVALTAIGLDLKTEIEQFREQIQNLE